MAYTDGVDFFAHQEAARRKTGLLVVYFVIAVVLIIAAVYAVVLGVFGIGSVHLASEAGPVRLLDPVLLLVSGGSALLIIFAGSAYKMAQLAGGGARVAQNLGGRLVRPDTTDYQERRLLNVVEEMALASGVPVPPVYLLDQEQAINAFAAGFSPDDAVIGVSRGMIDLLNRSEQQGVIAHEFSHILNGDMRLNIRLMGIVHGILVLGLLGRVILQAAPRSRSRDGKGAAGVLLFGLGLFLVGSVGVFFGKLIKSAVSRQREFLADASAAQFTRQPQGISGALKKIGGLRAGSQLRHPRAEEASHLFFGNGLRPSWFSLLSTHPPLVDRIQRIDPTFDGTFPKVRRPQPPAVPGRRRQAGKGVAGGGALPTGGLPGVPEIPGLPDVLALPVLAELAREPDRVMDTVGRPMREHIVAARRLMGGVPQPIRDAARTVHGARAVTYLLLLDQDSEVRERQLAALRNEARPEVLEDLDHLLPLRDAVAPEARLPLLDLALAALRALTPGEYREFKRRVQDLVEADEHIDLFEYALRSTLVRHLDVQFGLVSRRAPIQIYALRGIQDECACILSMLARLGHPDEAVARETFQAAALLLQQPKVVLTFQAKENCSLAAVDRALDRMRTVAPKVKKMVVAAALTCITHDKTVNVEEAELFRAVASAVDCPVPPWLLSTQSEPPDVPAAASAPPKTAG